jgi:hypothetical protein
MFKAHVSMDSGCIWPALFQAAMYVLANGLTARVRCAVPISRVFHMYLFQL